MYAPRYRQATFYAFADDRGRGEQALALAYTDVAAAFAAFLDDIGPERPIIIAGHSQGSAHAVRLIIETFGAPDLRRRLVVAYAPGYPVPTATLRAPGFPLGACATRSETACIASWNAIGARHFIPGFFERVPVSEPAGTRRHDGGEIVCTNPLDWLARRPARGYLGGFYRTAPGHSGLVPSVQGATCGSEGWLTIEDPADERFTEVMMSRGWYHVYEYALFWEAIRANVAERIAAFRASTRDR